MRRKNAWDIATAQKEPTQVTLVLKDNFDLMTIVYTVTGLHRKPQAAKPAQEESGNLLQRLAPLEQVAPLSDGVPIFCTSDL